jgi:predicted alpha/beta superfamily hydrolase
MTSVAGYITKKLFTVYQGVSLDKYGSDCHTKKYRTVTITNKNASAVMNRFILDGNKLIELTAEVMPKYIGKKVKMRSPLYCLG